MSEMGPGQPGVHFNPEAPRQRSGGSGPWVEPTPTSPLVKRVLLALGVLALLVLLLVVAVAVVGD